MEEDSKATGDSGPGPAGEAHRTAEPPMDLVEALKRVGPILGDPIEDALRQRAAVRIYDELRRLAPQFRSFEGLDPEDLCHDVLAKLLRNSPTRSQEDPPDTEGRVIGYLRAILHNAAVDHYRRTRGEVELGDERADPRPGVVRQIQDAERGRFEEQARHRLFEEIVPRLAAGMAARPRTSFLGGLRQLQDVAAGRISFDQIVREEARRGSARSKQPADDLLAAQNRLYQRYSRVLRPLWVAAEEVEVGDPAMGAALKQQVRRLRLRGSGVR